ncbi:MAG: aminotransferase class V-fold PLP-dependent enzyme [Cyclobacteriaceae bacterium]
MNWENIRQNYPVVADNTYLDTARTGAVSVNTINKVKAFLDDQLQNAALHREHWIDTMEKAREKTAQLLGVHKKDVGFQNDTSTVISIIAGAIEPNKKVVLVENDFPSVGLPWVKQGYEVLWVKRGADFSIDINKIEDALKQGGEIVAISWVQYNSGFKIDIEKLGELCEKYGAKLIVDGTQGICVFPINPEKLKIHAFIASGFKWMTAGYGITVVYLNDGFRKKLKTNVAGWNSLIDFFGNYDDENIKASTSAMELGHPKYHVITCLDSALDELNQIGLEKIQERTTELSTYLRKSIEQSGIQQLSNFSKENQSHIQLVEGSQDQFKKLAANNIRVTHRENYFRVSPYFYNNESDIDRLIEMLK